MANTKATYTATNLSEISNMDKIDSSDPSAFKYCICLASSWTEWLYNKEVRGSPQVLESDMVQACRVLLEERQGTNVCRLLQAINRNRTEDRNMIERDEVYGNIHEKALEYPDQFGSLAEYTAIEEKLVAIKSKNINFKVAEGFLLLF